MANQESKTGSKTDKPKLGLKDLLSLGAAALLGDTEPLEAAAEQVRADATQELKESRDAANGVLETTGVETPSLPTQTEADKAEPKKENP